MDFSILGPFEVRNGRRLIQVRRVKPRALLALLVLRRNELVSTGQLIEDLWEGHPPRSATKALQTYVSQLRRVLPEGVLETRPPGYVLHVPAGGVDSDRFEELVARGHAALDAGRSREARRILTDALGLWREGVLVDLPYERFADAERDRLHELRLSALEHRIDADLVLGRARDLVSELRVLVREHPLREGFTRQLMVSLYRSGRQADALDVFRATRERLRGELGLEPSRALQDLERLILQQEPSLEVVPSPAADAGAPRAAPALDRRTVVLGAAAAVVALAAGSFALTRRSGRGLAGVRPNHVGVVDPATNSIVDEVPNIARPGSIAVGRDAVWVASVADRTLTKIDPRRRVVIATVTLNNQTPTGVAVADDGVWVAHGLTGRLSRVDPQFERLTDTLQVVRKSFGLGSVAIGRDSVWAAYGDSTLARIDPRGPAIVGRGLVGAEPRAIVVAVEDVWVMSSGEGDTRLARYRPETFDEGPIDEVSLPRRPAALAFGEGALWVAHQADDIVTRVDVEGAVEQIRVGGRPTAIAVGQGAVWVANAAGRTVSRIDPRTNDVVGTIEIDNVPTGVAVGHEFVWVGAEGP